MTELRPSLSEHSPPAPPAVMVIFGAWGDLTKRLLTPALYNLAKAGLLDDGFKVVGVDHNDGDDELFRGCLEGFLHEQAAKGGEAGKEDIEPKVWDWLSQRLFYQKADFEDDGAYQALGRRLDEWGGGKPLNALFYLATSPRFFGTVATNLGKAKLNHEDKGQFRRLVIEKPFGSDLASAQDLNKTLGAAFGEPQLYRIDHFLGKETVRNIMVVRFANGVFEPLWNNQYIDHVQITAAETVGLEGRAAYYDHAGALRDMIPNHLFQLLAVTAMEAPESIDADAVREAKSKAIEAVAPIDPKDAVRGQYTAGEANGRSYVDYRKEPNVDADTCTETYAAVKLAIDNDRWRGVPFYLRTGKALAARRTEIVIQFKAPPHPLFEDQVEATKANALTLRIQPDEGAAMTIQVKRPGPQMDAGPAAMNFRYADFFKLPAATGYETLIYDVLTGDQTLFKDAGDIEFSWRAVQPVLDAWREGEPEFYAAGADGPKGAEAMMADDGRAWRPVRS